MIFIVEMPSTKEARTGVQRPEAAAGPSPSATAAGSGGSGRCTPGNPLLPSCRLLAEMRRVAGTFGGAFEWIPRGPG